MQAGIFFLLASFLSNTIEAKMWQRDVTQIWNEFCNLFYIFSLQVSSIDLIFLFDKYCMMSHQPRGPQISFFMFTIHPHIPSPCLLLRQHLLKYRLFQPLPSSHIHTFHLIFLYPHLVNIEFNHCTWDSKCMHLFVFSTVVYSNLSLINWSVIFCTHPLLTFNSFCSLWYFHLASAVKMSSCIVLKRCKEEAAISFSFSSMESQQQKAQTCYILPLIILLYLMICHGSQTH